jgi:MtN3 and saliva related transmembrane protein
MELNTIIGLLAGFLTTISGIPQLYKTLMTKKAADLSYWMIILVFIGMLLWLVYGIMIKDMPVILANAVSAAIYVMLLSLKIKYS